jgi:hypothetical protein
MVERFEEVERSERPSSSSSSSSETKLLSHLFRRCRCRCRPPSLQQESAGLEAARGERGAFDSANASSLSDARKRKESEERESETRRKKKRRRSEEERRSSFTVRMRQ